MKIKIIMLLLVTTMYHCKEKFTDTAEGKLDKIAVQMANATLTVKLGDFRADCGRLPSTAEGLDALLKPPANLPCAGTKFLRNDKLFGPRSGCRYKYELVTKSEYKLWYLGSDCREGSEGSKTDMLFEEIIEVIDGG